MKLAKARRPRPRGLDDALLPLVNVVFLLMVFFLAAGRLGARPPSAAAPKSQRQTAATAAAPRVLELRGDGLLLLDGQIFTDGELPGRSLAWQGQPLDVRAAGDVAAERVLRLLAILRGAGVRDVRLLTVKGAG